MEMQYLKDGYYLSVYSEIDPFMNFHNTSLRHDHNASLWRKLGADITLIAHWEFERISGFKHHAHAFTSEEQCFTFLNDLIKPFSLTINDLQEMIGTPGIDICNDYYENDFGKNHSYHAVAHMFSHYLVIP